MTKRRPTLEFLLKTINSLLTLSGLSVLLVGIYSLVQRKQDSKTHNANSGSESFLKVDDSKHHPFDKLPSVWCVYIFLALGTMLFLISCIGCVGTSRNPCCLSFYSVLLIGLVVAELVVAAFLLFNQDLGQKMLRGDSIGNVHSLFHFLQSNWRIIRWVVLVALVFQVIALILALYLRSMNRAVYDSSSSDDETIVYPVPRQTKRTATTSYANL